MMLHEGLKTSPSTTSYNQYYTTASITSSSASPINNSPSLNSNGGGNNPTYTLIRRNSGGVLSSDKSHQINTTGTGMYEIIRNNNSTRIPMAIHNEEIITSAASSCANYSATCAQPQMQQSSRPIQLTQSLPPPPSITRANTASSVYPISENKARLFVNVSPVNNNSPTNTYSNLNRISTHIASGSVTPAALSQMAKNSKDWRANITVEERQAVRKKIKEIYMKTCENYDALLEAVVTIEEDFVHSEAPSRLDYFKTGFEYEKRIVRKLDQINGKIDIIDLLNNDNSPCNVKKRKI